MWSKKKLRKRPPPRPKTFDILPSAWITNNSIFYRIFDLFIFFLLDGNGFYWSWIFSVMCCLEYLGEIKFEMLAFKGSLQAILKHPKACFTKGLVGRVSGSGFQCIWNEKQSLRGWLRMCVFHASLRERWLWPLRVFVAPYNFRIFFSLFL